MGELNLPMNEKVLPEKLNWLPLMLPGPAMVVSIVPEVRPPHDVVEKSVSSLKLLHWVPSDEMSNDIGYPRLVVPVQCPDTGVVVGVGVGVGVLVGVGVCALVGVGVEVGVLVGMAPGVLVGVGVGVGVLVGVAVDELDVQVPD